LNRTTAMRPTAPINHFRAACCVLGHDPTLISGHHFGEFIDENFEFKPAAGIARYFQIPTHRAFPWPPKS